MSTQLQDLIGQNHAKDRLNFHFDGYVNGEPFPSIIFCGQRGNGKTEIAKATAIKLRELSGGVKSAKLLNSSSIKNIKSWWNSVIIPEVNDKDVTLFFDECHKLPDDVSTALLTICNPNVTHKNTFCYEDYSVDFDLRRQTFLFATTEPQKVFAPLLNRMKRVDLQPYKNNELAKILQKNAPGIGFNDDVLAEMTPVCRSTARQAVMMAEDVLTYLAPKHKRYFSLDDWNQFRRTLDILPLGITRSELSVLRVLVDCADARIRKRYAAMLNSTCSPMA